jgi:tRNA (guanine-N7-)-methyltransferase
MAKDVRHIRGALYGSRFVEQPQIRPQVEALHAFLNEGGPTLVEVGFDHGRRLHSMARLNPNWRFVGLEVRERRVMEAKARAARDELANVLPWRLDARTVFAAVLEDASVDIVDVFFPTPWWNPALRAKRLLIDDHFVSDVARTLRPGGVLRVATDVESYAANIERTIAQSGLALSHLPAPGDDPPRCEQLSRREWKCEREGIPVFRFLGRVE